MLVLMTLCFVTFLYKSPNDNKYTGWKDTHIVYGDGTYVSYHMVNNGKDVYGITNTKCNQSIVEEILDEKKIDEKIYIIGLFYPYKVFVVINTNTNIARYYPIISSGEILGMTNINDLISSGTFEFLQSYDNFTNEEKKVFDSLNVDQS